MKALQAALEHREFIFSESNILLHPWFWSSDAVENVGDKVDT